MQQTIARLQREHEKMRLEPHEQIICEFNQDNIMEWHFILHKFQHAPYEGGMYHGIIEIPGGYPNKAPSIYFLTPNGRFKVGEKICLSYTSFHPESWTPTWTLKTMLIGVISFMYNNEQTAGGMVTSEGEKKRLAGLSQQFNMANDKFLRVFRKHLHSLNITEKPIRQVPLVIEQSSTVNAQQLFMVCGLIMIFGLYMYLIME